MEFMLALKDWFLNIVTLGWWGRYQGGKSSGATVVPRNHYPVDFASRGPRHPKGKGKRYE